ncbi:MAG: response regulator [Alphaproteobacteria bacterium]|nr:response regulator [Alphaproteobacteria bacterium]
MTETSPHILVVDDAREIREPLVKYLQKNGYRAMGAESAAVARKHLRAHAFDLIVLDILMPGEDGLSFCRSLRETSGVPVLFATAKGETVDRVVGIELGADDYVVKPYEPRELLARIGAILRRVNAMPPVRETAAARVRFGRWTFDTVRRELVDEAGVGAALSGGEYSLLCAFLARPNMTLTRDQLLDLTKGRDAAAFDRSVDNAIMRLRRKIEVDPRDPKIIKTVWGGGYVFAAEPVAA